MLLRPTLSVLDRDRVRKEGELWRESEDEKVVAEGEDVGSKGRWLGVETVVFTRWSECTGARGLLRVATLHWTLANYRGYDAMG